MAYLDSSGLSHMLSSLKQKIVPVTRKINNKDLGADITLTPTDVGAVPTTRTVNGKALSANISLSSTDVGAVPTTRKVNGKALSADITLAAGDVGAVPTSEKGVASGVATLDANGLVVQPLAFPANTINPNGVITLTDGVTGTLNYWKYGYTVEIYGEIVLPPTQIITSSPWLPPRTMPWYSSPGEGRRFKIFSHSNNDVAYARWMDISYQGIFRFYAATSPPTGSLGYIIYATYSTQLPN